MWRINLGNAAKYHVFVPLLAVGALVFFTVPLGRREGENYPVLFCPDLARRLVKYLPSFRLLSSSPKPFPGSADKLTD
jgi:hypothetical protein